MPLTTAEIEGIHTVIFDILDSMIEVTRGGALRLDYDTMNLLRSKKTSETVLHESFLPVVIEFATSSQYSLIYFGKDGKPDDPDLWRLRHPRVIHHSSSIDNYAKQLIKECQPEIERAYGIAISQNSG